MSEQNSQRDVLVIFIRNPIPGKVKTRIARTTGDQEALRIYSVLLFETRRAVSNTPVLRHLYYSDFIPEKDDWSEALFERRLQCAGDLGQRMADAFEKAFNAGAQRVVIIGSDTPEITPEILMQSFSMLEQYDVVIGPVPDGGYYLLGMNQFHPELFEGIAWSTDTVRSKTIEIAQNMGLSIFTLPMLNDIDTEADWLDFLKRETQRLGLPV